MNEALEEDLRHNRTQEKANTALVTTRVVTAGYKLYNSIHLVQAVRCSAAEASMEELAAMREQLQVDFRESCLCNSSQACETILSPPY